MNSKLKALFIKTIKILTLSARRFNENKCYLMASALTFYFLLSVVPLVAIALGIAKGFGYEKLLEKKLVEDFPGYHEVASQIIAYATNLLEKTRSSAIAGVGAIILIWAGIKLLENIEDSLNMIWEVETSRSFTRKFSDYLSMLFIIPIFLVLSSGITFLISAIMTYITGKISVVKFLTLFSLKFLPYCFLSTFFIVIYIFLPNTKVRIKPALLAGIITGIIYQCAQWIYIKFQIGVASYNAIYGSFSAFPLFLAWVQVSWFIVLFGAQISFACQNLDWYESKHGVKNVTPFFKKILALEITRQIIKKFEKGEHPIGAPEISNSINIPIFLITNMLIELIEANVIVEIESKLDYSIYQPALDINKISISYVFEALEQKGESYLPINETSEIKIILDIMESFKNMIENSTSNRLLKDI
ncbi:MAG: YihY/virulence factor BrkB family protein [Desulfobacterales bacterium]|nr:YihY/virulence factor BrkB family protein [Desulfobacterales bacterium]